MTDQEMNQAVAEAEPTNKHKKQRNAIVSGDKYGRLTAINFSHTSKSRNSIWLWLCECGNTKSISTSDVRSGHTTSCGCFRSQTTASLKTRHGNARRKAHSPEYRTWCGMIARVKNPLSPSYPNYGGRGIKVCAAWEESFAQFLHDVGLKPSPIHSIDRIDNDGNYEPKNVKWSTPKEQSNNRRRRRWKKMPRILPPNDWKV